MALNQYVYDLDGDEPYLFVVKDPSEVNTSLYNREVTLTASNIEIFTVTVETWDRFGNLDQDCAATDFIYLWDCFERHF